MKVILMEDATWKTRPELFTFAMIIQKTLSQDSVNSFFCCLGEALTNGEYHRSYYLDLD